MTNEAFAVIANRPRYERDGIERLQHHLRQFRQYPDAVVNRDDFVVTSGDAKQMTAAQWAVVQEVQSLLPEATIVVRLHKIAWKCEIKMALPPLFGMLVTQRVGPFTLRREYAAPA